ncbi:hypothetical protein [Streptomyces sp. S.PNR 29]|uniref:hypothetical protein n=1 Tax=Streptomyces sp. S.PNR 29 TaxID=2973805 RepID=UPI0025B0C1C8|nr:hypothetical protein [Streptomyces sp. S.PNR 29]MDN0196554.1 hypothetical protein [Streptomyces sp. S.PNR 29]
MKREIGLGDVARALAVLRPEDPRTARAIARMLGHDLGAAAEERAPFATVTPSVASRLSSPAAEAAPPSAPQGRRTLPDRPAAPAEDVPSVLEELTVADTRHYPAWLEAQTPLVPGGPPPAVRNDGLAYRGHQESHVPLTVPRWAPGIFHAASQHPDATREVDLGAVLRAMLCGRVLTRVPYRRRLSSRLGVQLLLDMGPGMAPYQADRHWLRAHFRRLHSSDRLEILSFSTSPLLAGTGPRHRWAPYRPPHPGTPVVAFSDLGLTLGSEDGDDSDGPAEAWLRFAAMAARGGGLPLCLTPYPVTAYPAELRRSLVLIEMSRTTTASLLRHAVVKRSEPGRRRW